MTRQFRFVIVALCLGATATVADDDACPDEVEGCITVGATVADLGQASGTAFRGDRLLLFRRIGTTLGCGGSTRQRLECIADLRRDGVYNRVVDVFDMRNITLDSQSDFRVEVGRDIPCGVG